MPNVRSAQWRTTHRQLTVWLTTAEIEAIKQHAKDKGVSVAELVRSLAKGGDAHMSEPYTGDPPKLVTPPGA